MSDDGGGDHSLYAAAPRSPSPMNKKQAKRPLISGASFASRKSTKNTMFGINAWNLPYLEEQGEDEEPPAEPPADPTADGSQGEGVGEGDDAEPPAEESGGDMAEAGDPTPAPPPPAKSSESIIQPLWASSLPPLQGPGSRSQPPWATMHEGLEEVYVPPMSGVFPTPNAAMFERLLIKVVYGEPRDGHRVGVPPGLNDTLYRWVLKQNHSPDNLEVTWTYNGVGVKVTWIPGDFACPSWAEPPAGWEPNNDEAAWLRAWGKQMLPRLILDPTVDPRDPFREDDLWTQIITGRPWGPVEIRGHAQRVCVHKLEQAAPDHVQLEGLRGLWELCATKEYREEVTEPAYEAVARVARESLSNENVVIASIIMWMLSAAASSRARVLAAGGVVGLYRCIAMGLALSLQAPSAERQNLRDRHIVCGLGALCVLSVDKRARHDMLKEEPDFATIFRVLNLHVTDMDDTNGPAKSIKKTKSKRDKSLPKGARPVLEVKGKRRRRAIDTLYSCLARDRECRRQFAAFGGIKNLSPFCNSPSPHVRYVTSLIMSSYAQDVGEDSNVA
eukprot:CAMPEP_0182883980 /NCGR_PEP_ID=MMETSP0034_2-20130328/18707_1 /TAXON_ID=156128 /ORGANISM="Nephroselmis pyriformis, Strain CCMP717" /LENGTH=557 /DNA_ID=CAMNT_0025017143 /DNA_START=92 /DNA_END=1761 /DNA_ORIENTATION=-